MATRRTMVLMACSLTLVQLVVLCSAAKEQQQQELCSGKKVGLRSLSDLERTSAEGCAESIVKAFEDLKRLVLGEKRICTMKKATGITDYYETHLKHGRQDSLPRELVRFAIAYGMQVNSQCKWLMTGTFYRKVDQNVFESEYDEIKQWTSDNGPIDRLLSPLIKQGEILVPSDFEILLPKPEREALLGLDSLDADKMIRVKDVCKNRFWSHYDGMLLPIAHLDRHGLNYKSAQLSKHLARSIEVRKHNILWSRIVFFCESVKQMGEFNVEEMGPSKVRFPIIMNPHLEIKDQVVVSPLKSAIDAYDVNLSVVDRFKNRISDTLKSSGQSKESLASLIETVFKNVDGGEQDEELKRTKKELLSLLDPANRGKFVKAISNMLTGGKKVGRRIANALTTSLVVGVAVVFHDANIARQAIRPPVDLFKKSDMERQTFRDA